MPCPTEVSPPLKNLCALAASAQLKKIIAKFAQQYQRKHNTSFGASQCTRVPLAKTPNANGTDTATAANVLSMGKTASCLSWRNTLKLRIIRSQAPTALPRFQAQYIPRFSSRSFMSMKTREILLLTCYRNLQYILLQIAIEQSLPREHNGPGTRND